MLLLPDPFDKFSSISMRKIEFKARVVLELTNANREQVESRFMRLSASIAAKADAGGIAGAMLIVG